MNRVILAGVAAMAVACGPKDLRTYGNSILELGAGFNARMVCTCLYVAERSIDECSEWTRVNPDLARFTVDASTRTVTSKVLGGARTVATYVDDQVGCEYVED